MKQYGLLKLPDLLKKKMSRFQFARSYLGYFARKLKSDPFLIANWRWIEETRILHDDLFEALLLKTFVDRSDPVFLQIGANTGTGRQDVYNCIKKTNIKTILVEPQPDVFEQLKENYKNIYNVEVINVALGEKNEKRMMYRLSDEAKKYHNKVAGFGNCVASFDRNHVVECFLKNTTIEGGSMDCDKLLERLEVDCVTFDGLLERFGLSQVDVVMIDTEGFDYAILKMMFASQCFPDVVKFEHAYLGSHKRDAWNLLYSLSYRMVLCENDTIAIKISS